MSWAAVNNSILLSRVRQKLWYVTILGPLSTDTLPYSLRSLALGEASCHIMRTFKTALWGEPREGNGTPPPTSQAARFSALQSRARVTEIYHQGFHMGPSQSPPAKTSTPWSPVAGADAGPCTGAQSLNAQLSQVRTTLPVSCIRVWPQQCFPVKEIQAELHMYLLENVAYREERPPSLPLSPSCWLECGCDGRSTSIHCG